jgi:hypothetical protein
MMMQRRPHNYNEAPPEMAKEQPPVQLGYPFTYCFLNEILSLFFFLNFLLSDTKIFKVIP